MVESQSVEERGTRRVGVRGVHPTAVATGSGSLRAACVTPDGGCALVVGDSGTVTRWDLRTGRADRDFTDGTRRFESACLTLDGAAVAAGAHRDVVVWGAADGVRRLTLRHPDPVDGMCAAPGQRLVTEDQRHVVRVWGLGTGQCLTTLTLADRARLLCITADGRQLVSGHVDGAVRFWDLSSGLLVRCLTGSGQPTAACATADGRRLLVADGPSIAAWDLPTGRRVGSLTGHDGTVLSVCVTADDRYALSTGTDATVRIWELSSGRCLRTLTGHQGPVPAVGIAPDGRQAASVGEDGTIRSWAIDWELAADDFTGWRAELAPRFGRYLARLADRPTPSGHRPRRRADRSGWVDDVGTDRDVELLCGELAAAGYGALAPEDVRAELRRLLHQISAGDTDADLDPYPAVILSRLARRHAAANQRTPAIRAGAQALACWRRLADAEPDTYRHDLISGLLDQGSWLTGVGRLIEARAANDEALRCCRDAGAQHRELLSRVLHERYLLLRRQKRPDEIAELARTMQHDFAASTRQEYLAGLDDAAGSADPDRLRRASSAAAELVASYEALPGTDDRRDAGSTVARCARIRLARSAGEPDGPLLPGAWLSWQRWYLQSRQTNACRAVAIGMDLIDLLEDGGSLGWASLLRSTLGVQ